MHPNPAYRKTPTDQNLAFARARGFGTLAVNGAAGPMLSHVPFVIREDGKTVEIHLVRSNPILRALSAPQPAVIAVNGPDSYISPDWYGIEDQVPTWNYVAVHLRGTLEAGPEDEFRALLDRLAAEFEGRLLPKTPWKSDKMTEGLMERMMRQIAPCRFVIEDVQGTWKLTQNKIASARLGAADGVEAARLGHQAKALAELMRAVPVE